MNDQRPHWSGPLNCAKTRRTASRSCCFPANVLRLQESVGVDDDTRAVFAQRLSAVQANAPAGAVLLGLFVGLSAAQLQAEKA